MSIRDYLSDIPVRTRLAANRAHVGFSNAWHRVAGRRILGAGQQYRNWLNRRARTRGTAPLPDRVTRAAGARTPVYRNRVDPATGRPRRVYAPDRQTLHTDPPRRTRTVWDKARTQGRAGRN